ncbi:MAG: hypothetical protein ACTH5F_00290 [Pseudolactococcus laudensis]
MSIIDYFKDLKAIGGDFISETAEAKKHLDTVKFELGYAQFVMDDIKKTSKNISSKHSQELMRLTHYRLKFKTSSQNN